MFIALLCLSINKITGETSEKERRLPSVAVRRLFSIRMPQKPELLSDGGVQRVLSERKRWNSGYLQQCCVENLGIEKENHFCLRKACVEQLHMLLKMICCGADLLTVPSP